MTSTITHWAGGAAWQGSSDRWAEVTNPATGEVTGHVALASTADADHVIGVAERASQEWRRTSLARRTQVMFAFRELLNARKDELAAIINAEHGKVHSDALGEVAGARRSSSSPAAFSHLLKGGHSDGASTGVDVHSIREASAWSDDLAIEFLAMVPMCLFRWPSRPERRRLSPARRTLGRELDRRLWTEAGLPDGVSTCSTGTRSRSTPSSRARSCSRSASSAPRRSPSTSTSARPARQAGPGPRRRQEPHGVLPDADLDPAVDAAVYAAYGSGGERCMAISVLVAVGLIADDLVARIADRTATLVTGAGAGAPTVARPTGPLSRRHTHRVAGLSTPARRPAPRSSSTDATSGPGRAGGLLARPDPLRPCPAGHGHLHRGDLRPGALRRPGRELRRGAGPGQRQPVWQRDRGLHQRRRRRQAVREPRPGRHDRINVPIPVPVAYYSFGGWNGPCSATPTPTASKVSTSSPAAGRHHPVGRPRQSPEGGLELGFPHND